MTKQEQIDELKEELAEVENNISSLRCDVESNKAFYRQAREKYEQEDEIEDLYFQEMENYQFWLDESEGDLMIEEQKRARVRQQIRELGGNPEE